MSERPDHDPLDELLAAARWPEASAGSTRRLTRYWKRLSDDSPTHGWIGWSAAAAAVLIVSAGAWFLIDRKRVSPVKMATNVPAAVENRSPTAPAPLVARPPTVREMILLRFAERQEKRSILVPLPPPQDDPAARAAHLAVLVEHSDGLVNEAIARDFAQIALPEHFSTIMKMWRHEPLRPAILDAVARLADAQTLASAARNSSSDRRRRLVIALLQRKNPLPQYLPLVADEATRADALAALDDLKNPPTEELTAMFAAPRADLRVAAAWALGRIDGPATTRRMIELVAAGQYRREAFIALASSRGEDAQAFVKQAAQSTRLAGWVQSTLAQPELQQLTRSPS